MDLKHTRALGVFVDNHLETGDLVIHPNDGFDLGLMNDKFNLALSCNTKEKTDAGLRPVKILLRNACRSGTLQVSKKQWELLGKEQQVMLAIKTNRLFIIATKKVPGSSKE